jgi:hypothetical protein
VNVLNARVKELSHQEGSQESKKHEKVDCSESDGFFGRVLRFVFMAIMVQEVNANSVNDKRGHEAEEAFVPFSVQKEPRCAVSSVEKGLVHLEGCEKKVIVHAFILH